MLLIILVYCFSSHFEYYLENTRKNKSKQITKKNHLNGFDLLNKYGFCNDFYSGFGFNLKIIAISKKKIGKSWLNFIGLLYFKSVVSCKYQYSNFANNLLNSI